MAVFAAETGTAAAPQGSSQVLAEAYQVYGELVIAAQTDPVAKEQLDAFHAQQQAQTDLLRQSAEVTEAYILLEIADLTARGIPVPPRP